jgi:hypothetical protein
VMQNGAAVGSVAIGRLGSQEFADNAGDNL